MALVVFSKQSRRSCVETVAYAHVEDVSSAQAERARTTALTKKFVDEYFGALDPDRGSQDSYAATLNALWEFAQNPDNLDTLTDGLLRRVLACCDPAAYDGDVLKAACRCLWKLSELDAPPGLRQRLVDLGILEALLRVVEAMTRSEADLASGGVTRLLHGDHESPEAEIVDGDVLYVATGCLVTLVYRAPALRVYMYEHRGLGVLATTAVASSMDTGTQLVAMQGLWFCIKSSPRAREVFVRRGGFSTLATLAGSRGVDVLLLSTVAMGVLATDPGILALDGVAGTLVALHALLDLCVWCAREIEEKHEKYATLLSCGVASMWGLAALTIRCGDEPLDDLNGDDLHKLVLQCRHMDETYTPTRRRARSYRHRPAPSSPWARVKLAICAHAVRDDESSASPESLGLDAFADDFIMRDHKSQDQAAAEQFMERRDAEEYKKHNMFSAAALAVSDLGTASGKLGAISEDDDDLDDDDEGEADREATPHGLEPHVLLDNILCTCALVMGASLAAAVVDLGLFLDFVASDARSEDARVAAARVVQKTTELGGPSKTASLLQSDRFDRVCGLVTDGGVPAAARASLAAAVSHAATRRGGSPARTPRRPRAAPSPRRRCRGASAASGPSRRLGRR